MSKFSKLHGALFLRARTQVARIRCHIEVWHRRIGKLTSVFLALIMLKDIKIILPVPAILHDFDKYQSACSVVTLTFGNELASFFGE